MQGTHSDDLLQQTRPWACEAQSGATVVSTKCFWEHSSTYSHQTESHLGLTEYNCQVLPIPDQTQGSQHSYVAHQNVFSYSESMHLATQQPQVFLEESAAAKHCAADGAGKHFITTNICYGMVGELYTFSQY